MNLWTSSSTTKIAATTITTDDNASMMEAFMSSSSDLGSFWPATYAPNPADQSKSSASAAQIFNYETLQKRLSTLIEGAHESWTYAIFWQSSVVDYGGPFLLGWGDGYCQNIFPIIYQLREMGGGGCRLVVVAAGGECSGWEWF